MSYLFFVLFILDVAMSRAGIVDVPELTLSRETMTILAYLHFGVVLAGYLYLVLKKRASKRLFAVFAVEKKARPAFIILGLWTLVTVVAAIEGMVAGNKRTFIEGDSYKFLLLPLLFGLAYFGLRSTQEVNRVLKGLVVLLGLLLAFDCVRFRGFVGAGYRFIAPSTYHMLTLFPLIIYLFFRREGGKAYRAIFIVVIVEVFAAMVLSQAMVGYVCAFLALMVFLFFRKKIKLALGGALVLAIAYWGIYRMEALVSGKRTYEYTKIQRVAAASTTPGGFVARFLGDRLMQGSFILDYFKNSPQRLPFGSGMGGDVGTSPVGSWFASLVPQHFIEIAIFEVLYRSGLAGLTLLLVFFGFVFRRGQGLVSGPQREYGIFVMANALYQCATLAGPVPLAHPWMILSVSLAGTFVMSREKAAKVVEWRQHENSYFFRRLSAIGIRERGRRSRPRPATR